MRKQIHDALLVQAQNGQFLQASYDPDTGLLIQGPSIAAASIETNEVSSAYSRERRHGRKLRDDHTVWLWELRLRFETEVITELFEKELLANPITIPRDTADPDSRQVILSLIRSRYAHPARLGSSNGTEVVFELNAQLSAI